MSSSYPIVLGVFFKDSVSYLKIQSSWSFLDVAKCLEQPDHPTILESSHPELFSAFKTGDLSEVQPLYHILRPNPAYEKWKRNSLQRVDQASTASAIEQELVNTSNNSNHRCLGPFKLTIVPADSLIILVQDQDVNRTVTRSLPYDLVERDCKTVGTFLSTLETNLNLDNEFNNWNNLLTSKSPTKKMYWMDHANQSTFFNYLNGKVDPHFLTVVLVHTKIRPSWQQHLPYQLPFFRVLLLTMLITFVTWTWSEATFDQVREDMFIMFEYATRFTNYNYFTLKNRLADMWYSVVRQ